MTSLIIQYMATAWQATSNAIDAIFDDCAAAIGLATVPCRIEGCAPRGSRPTVR